MTDADNRPAVVGQVERPVRPLVERMRLWLDGATDDTSAELMRLAVDEIDAMNRQIELLIYTESDPLMDRINRNRKLF